MSRSDKTWWFVSTIVAVTVAAIVYTVSAMAYLDSRFVGRDVFSMVTQRLDRIESKLDTVINKGR